MVTEPISDHLIGLIESVGLQCDVNVVLKRRENSFIKTKILTVSPCLVIVVVFCLSCVVLGSITSRWSGNKAAFLSPNKGKPRERRKSSLLWSQSRFLTIL